MPDFYFLNIPSKILFFFFLTKGNDNADRSSSRYWSQLTSEKKTNLPVEEIGDLVVGTSPRNKE